MLTRMAEQAWVAVAEADLHWWVGTYGGAGHDTMLVRAEGFALESGGQVGITERSPEGWSFYLFDAATGDGSLVAQAKFPLSRVAVAIPSLPGQLFVADAGEGSTGALWEFRLGADGSEVIRGAATAEARDLTVLKLSASRSTLLHSFCSEVDCRATVVGPAGTVTLAPDLFPVATTDLTVLAFEDLDGLRWAVVDIKSGNRVPLLDPTGSIRRPISRATPLDDVTFLVEDGGELLAVDSRDGSVRLLVRQSARAGWEIVGSPIDGRWLLLGRVKVEDGPVLTTDQLRSIAVLDLQTGTIRDSVVALPFPP